MDAGPFDVCFLPGLRLWIGLRPPILRQTTADCSHLHPLDAVLIELERIGCNTSGGCVQVSFQVLVGIVLKYLAKGWTYQ